MDDKLRELMEKRKWVSMSRERLIMEQMQHASNGHTAHGAREEDAIEDVHAAEAYAVRFEKPVDAVESGVSLLDLHVPGTMAPGDLSLNVNLDEMKVILGRGQVHEMQDLQSFSIGSILDPTSIKGIMAEFAACVGRTFAEEIVVDFRAG